ncbi:MAG: NYN domain-containing protein [Candidatus Omnitrophota bacterium]|jgi:predicted RNA-binding protein with PIN domain|nr:NYN domain-containing protein [Candidatus Omnitrophota bacterium]
MKCLIIDGYNAISKIKVFDAKKDISLESSRLSFIKALVDFRRRNRSFDKIIVVFDGKSEGLGLEREAYGDVEVLFSNKDKDADKVIIDILKISSGKNKITVSSDDNSIKNHARAFGCRIISIKELEDLIILKKKASRSKIIEKDIGDKDQDAITNELKKYWGVE